MSRAYWVKLSSSVVETIEASDKATHRIELEAVVPESEMESILEGALAEAGWEKGDDGRTWRRQVGDVQLTWKLDDNVVEASVEGSHEVSRDVNVEGQAYSEDAARRNAQRQLEEREQAARDAIAGEAEQLQKKLTRQLGDNEQERVREINTVLQKAYAEALKRKAKRLGNVTSVQEGTSNQGEYQLTITISE